MKPAGLNKAVLLEKGESAITRAPSLHFPPHNPFRSGLPLRVAGRCLLLMGSLLLMTGFLLAASLSPDPDGYGTHQQLGLPPCAFRLLLGIPCPSCGLTTSFSHFVHGEWMAAARVHVGGFLLALTCALLVPWCWASAAVGRLCGIRHPLSFLTHWIVVIGAVLFAHWIVRLID